MVGGARVAGGVAVAEVRVGTGEAAMVPVVGAAVLTEEVAWVVAMAVAMADAMGVAAEEKVEVEDWDMVRDPPRLLTRS